jgi:hypothetical protein
MRKRATCASPILSEIRTFGFLDTRSLGSVVVAASDISRFYQQSLHSESQWLLLDAEMDH